MKAFRSRVGLLTIAALLPLASGLAKRGDCATPANWGRLVPDWLTTEAADNAGTHYGLSPQLAARFANQAAEADLIALSGRGTLLFSTLPKRETSDLVRNLLGIESRSLTFGPASSNQPPLPKQTSPGLFEDATERALPPDSSWAMTADCGDVDGDGDVDLLVGHSKFRSPGKVQLLINDGSGAFRDESRERIPEPRLSTYFVKLVDLDSDDDLDAYLVCQSPSIGIPPKHVVLINDGSGVFRDETAERLPPALEMNASPLIADLTGDGAPDILAPHWMLEDDSTTLYFLQNDGTGHFPADRVQRFRIERRAVSALTAADIDNDGDLDPLVACASITTIRISQDTVVVNYPGTDILLLNEGQGRFRDVTRSLIPRADEDWTSWIVPSDVDGDGDVDLLLVNNLCVDPAPDRLLINQGDGHFVDETSERLPPEPANSSAGALFADFTGDGAPELFYWCVSFYPRGPSLDRLLLNDGQGHFADISAGNLPQVVDYTSAVVAGDFDGDGDLDLFLANRPASNSDTTMAVNRIYLNTGAVTAVRLRTEDASPRSFRLVGAYPNPFNASTIISYELGKASAVELAIYELLGRRVRSLEKGQRAAGAHRVRWDGTDDAGRPLPSGVYLLRLQAAGQVAVRKVVLVR